MILSPEQLQKVRKKRIRELNEKKEAFKSSACTQWGKDALQSSEEHILPPTTVGTEILIFTRRIFNPKWIEAPDQLFSKFAVGVPKVVFEPIRQGRVIVFDLETSGFSAEDR